jgi:hypothetical protein
LTDQYLFYRQAEAMADHKFRGACEKATHLLTILQGQATYFLRSIAAEAIYEDIVEVLKGL